MSPKGLSRSVLEQTPLHDSQGHEDHLHAVLDNMVDGVITIDKSGTILSWNTACKKIFGYEPSETIGKNVSMLMPEPDRSRHDSYIAKYLQTGEAKIIGIGREVTGRRKNGSVFPIDLSIGKVTERNAFTFVGIVRDITERKETEEQLRKSHQAMDDFVYIVSHDLKEPLRGIYSYAHFLLEDYADRLDSDGQDKLNTVEKLARRMESLIDSLLCYSRIGRVDLAFRETDLNEVVRNTLDLMEPILNQPNISVTISGPLPTIVCDETHTSEIFRNLITNGLKYNESPHKKIEIGCTTNHPDFTGCPLFYVADNGIGIEEQHHENIFKMFKRLHAKDAYGGGTGSGLPIVRKIVERHNGKVWVISDGRNGSTFYFTLQPCDKEKQTF